MVAQCSAAVLCMPAQAVQWYLLLLGQSCTFGQYWMLRDTWLGSTSTSAHTVGNPRIIRASFMHDHCTNYTTGPIRLYALTHLREHEPQQLRGRGLADDGSEGNHAAAGAEGGVDEQRDLDRDVVGLLVPEHLRQGEVSKGGTLK